MGHFVVDEADDPDLAWKCHQAILGMQDNGTEPRDHQTPGDRP